MTFFNQKVILFSALLVAVAGMASAVTYWRLSVPGQCEQEISVALQHATEAGQAVLGSETPIPSDIIAGGLSVISEPRLGEKKVSVRTSYENPAGSDDIGFNVVVDKDDVIRDASVDVLATHEMSRKRQESFAEELPQILKGKKLHDLEALDVTGEANLTTKAFNDSLERLKSN